MSIEQKLLEIKEMGRLALEGKSVDEIGKEFDMRPYRVKQIISALGLAVGRPAYNIFNSQPKKLDNLSKGGFYAKFNIPRHLTEDMGLDKSKKWAFTGKIISKGKIEINFKPAV